MIAVAHVKWDCKVIRLFFFEIKNSRIDSIMLIRATEWHDQMGKIIQRCHAGWSQIILMSHVDHVTLSYHIFMIIRSGVRARASGSLSDLDFITRGTRRASSITPSLSFMQMRKQPDTLETTKTLTSYYLNLFKSLRYFQIDQVYFTAVNYRQWWVYGELMMSLLWANGENIAYWFDGYTV